MNPWAGPMGAEYATRNVHDTDERARAFTSILDSQPGIRSAVELGCGRGTNLAALRRALPAAPLIGVEINQHAYDLACALFPVATNPVVGLYCTDILAAGDAFCSAMRSDLALTCGLLIHIPPERLPRAYEVLDLVGRRWILMCEYFCPKPREIPYRDGAFCGARDFAGEFLDAYPAWSLVSSRFLYKREWPAFDNVTAFLMERR